MGQVNEIMIRHPEICNAETRVPDMKYIMKKYNFDEIIIVNSKQFPIGIVNSKSISDEAMKNILHPFDVKAENVMNRIAVTVSKNSSDLDGLKLMEENHLSILPVIDNDGHCLGLVKKDDLLKEIRLYTANDSLFK